MKYKVGDKVKIKNLDWYNANKSETGYLYCDNIGFVQKMSEYCGKKATIVDRTGISYKLDIDNKFYYWTDDMFEEYFNDMEQKEIIIPQGWEIDEVRGNKIILMESKKELPKTWEECIAKIGRDLEYIYRNGFINKTTFSENVSSDHINDIPVGLGKPMLALCQLLVCREVYRQGWKPDWSDGKTKWTIEYASNHILSLCYMQTSKVLSFQSKEIRDQFLENFKGLIEEAKELI